MTLLDGKALAARLRQEMAAEVRAALAAGQRPPGLAVILVGEDAASLVYVRNKQKACEEVGIFSLLCQLPARASLPELQDLIAALNARADIDGVLLQLPLPARFETQACLAAIDPAKDVDGFHPLNMGRLVLGLPGFIPCTPKGVLALLRHYKLSLTGKRAVVVGRSDIVGKPLALLLARRDANATVTLCHSATVDLGAVCREADFLFVAIGRPCAITAGMVKPGAVVVDVGINRMESGLCGDVDFAAVAGEAAYLTPVPGGVGPMTIAMLLRNTLEAWQARLKGEA